MLSSRSRIHALVETAIFAALAMALSFIPDFVSWFSPSWGSIPIVILALRRGTKYGLLGGLLWGLLHFLMGKVYYLSLIQVIIEYPLAFTSLGLAGLFALPFLKALSKQRTGQALLFGLLAAFTGLLARYFWHYVAGVVFWQAYAGKMSPYLYSLMVNGIAALGTWLVTSLAVVVLIWAYPQFFEKKA
ncbi:energy-coupled thiamine transporter ThiT [Streptococcus sp. DD12]|uniref:energy-coupled thiamine transporter ThiT n=1 Tax=Streptococcus sp. DD12 TaxID=1777880 RepID=UPI00079AC4F8|nr:energy-coupled thiamine transporter ThiT [Streptococcus sp. DD12]KXT76831.1 Substrate-specific component ThiT of thiamin ECF transporter [Streptococcus sp. DD12]